MKTNRYTVLPSAPPPPLAPGPVPVYPRYPPPPPPYSVSSAYMNRFDSLYNRPSSFQPRPIPPPIAEPQPTADQSTTPFGPYPRTAFCPACRQFIVTSITHKTGVVTWLTSTACCLLGGFLGCFLIPCCTDFTRDVEHSCCLCGLKLGLYKRI